MLPAWEFASLTEGTHGLEADHVDLLHFFKGPVQSLLLVFLLCAIQKIAVVRERLNGILTPERCLCLCPNSRKGDALPSFPYNQKKHFHQRAVLRRPLELLVENVGTSPAQWST